MHHGGNQPREFSNAMIRATNDWMADKWFGTDPRWLGSISVPFDHGPETAQEITRCLDQSDRWVQVLLPVRMTSPLGNPRYRELIEIAVDRDIPIGPARLQRHGDLLLLL